jgi:hypothetical protein
LQKGRSWLRTMLIHVCSVKGLKAATRDGALRSGALASFALLAPPGPPDWSAAPP